jgi:hypothetical protein
MVWGGHWSQEVLLSVLWLDPVGEAVGGGNNDGDNGGDNDGIQVKELVAACLGISMTSTHKHLGLLLALNRHSQPSAKDNAEFSSVLW